MANTTNSAKEELSRVKASISERDQIIRDLDEQFGRALKAREEDCTRLMGLEAKIASGEGSPELMDYFLANRRLNLESVEGTQLKFYVRGYLEFFDSDMAESVIDNRHGYIYNEDHDFDSEGGQNMRALMKELFVSDSPRMRIKTCAAYSLDVRGEVRGLDRYRFGVSEKDRLPNPHINRYSCLGNYVRSINARLAERDYIGAIEQCVASCASLNFGDTTVMHHFMNSMWSSMAGEESGKFIELQDGRVVSALEACEWLKSEDGTGEKEGQEGEEA